MKGKRYFKCEANKGMFILAKEIQRKLSPEELIQKIIHLSEALSRARQQRQNNLRSMATAGEKQRMQEDMITRLKKVNECISSHPQPFQIWHISNTCQAMQKSLKCSQPYRQISLNVLTSPNPKAVFQSENINSVQLHHHAQYFLFLPSFIQVFENFFF